MMIVMMMRMIMGRLQKGFIGSGIAQAMGWGQGKLKCGKIIPQGVSHNNHPRSIVITMVWIRTTNYPTHVFLYVGQRRRLLYMMRFNATDGRAIIRNDDSRWNTTIGIEQGATLPIDQHDARGIGTSPDIAHHFTIHGHVCTVTG